MALGSSCLFLKQLRCEHCSHTGYVNMLYIAHFQGTGNVLLDMERQLQANSVRVQVLEQENSALHSSLGKLRERTQSNGSRVRLV